MTFSNTGSTFKNYYVILGLNERAAPEDIKKSFHNLGKIIYNMF